MTKIFLLPISLFLVVLTAACQSDLSGRYLQQQSEKPHFVLTLNKDGTASYTPTESVKGAKLVSIHYTWTQMSDSMISLIDVETQKRYFVKIFEHDFKDLSGLPKHMVKLKDSN